MALRGATVLVVDDDASIRSALEKLLSAEGLQVATANDGRGALTAIEGFQPDLVLLDVQMPEVDGFEVCRTLKSDSATMLTPVVLITGLGAVEDRVRGIEAGADDFLSKPFEQVELLARVRSLLRVKRYTDELERAESVLLALARSIEGKDPYTEGHCERLSAYGSELGRRLGLSEDHVRALELGGVVHDIGKIGVPDAILLKQGPLTDEEWDVMREHPVTGERICQDLRSFRLVLAIIRHHHEKQDGSGYPDGLKGEEVPLTARVLQVVDVYDALTTERPYKPALASDAAFETIGAETEKGWWDPRVVAEFCRYLSETHSSSTASELGGHSE